MQSPTSERLLLRAPRRLASGVGSSGQSISSLLLYHGQVSLCQGFAALEVDGTKARMSAAEPRELPSPFATKVHLSVAFGLKLFRGLHKSFPGSLDAVFARPQGAHTPSLSGSSSFNVRDTLCDLRLLPWLTMCTLEQADGPDSLAIGMQLLSESMVDCNTEVESEAKTAVVSQGLSAALSQTLAALDIVHCKLSLPLAAMKVLKTPEHLR